MSFLKSKIGVFCTAAFLLILIKASLEIEQIQHSFLSYTKNFILLQANSQEKNLNNHGLKKSFPDDIGWIDIKKKYGAKGDGITDDTSAIKKALAEPDSDYGRPKILYFPSGTYIVKDTLQFPSGNNNCCVTFQGQGKTETIIKLKDNSPGFSNRDVPKAVIKTTQGNMAFRNYIRDLTVDTSNNNEGSIGIDYVSNNRGGIINVAIKSGDRHGVTGLSMIRKWPGPSLIKNVSIEGFDIGIHSKHREYGIVLEHIKLKNQRILGILNEGNTLAIRSLLSTNSIPVINNKKGLVVVVEGDFKGGSKKVSAINNQAYLYARKINAPGYQSPIIDKGNVISNVNREYVSRKVFTLFDLSVNRSLNLLIRETPIFHDNNLANWANVKSYPSIKAALNSGKSTIYFPKGRYILDEDVEVPSTVRKIIGFESFINLDRGDLKGSLIIKKSSKNPLIIEGLLMNNIFIEHLSKRALVLKHSKMLTGEVKNSSSSGRLFLEDVQMFLNPTYSQNLWARQLNAERLSPPKIKLENNGGRFWILGLKTEQKGTVIKTTDGGKTELLGGLIYPVERFDQSDLSQAAFVNNQSSHSISYSVSAYGKNRNYKFQIREIREGKVKTILSTQMPDKTMPLFIGR